MMKLEYFLDNINDFNVPKLPDGKANSVNELYGSLIENSLPKIETIENWHGLLLKYIQQEDAIFFIRRYASASNKDWNLIRRGFLTEYSSGLKYVFCDNFFAHYFYLMALHNFTPTFDDFVEHIKSRKFPYGFMKTSEEEPFQAFPKGKTVSINTAGWKLAHLYSVNQNDYNFDYKKISMELFPRGNQNDWRNNNGNDYPSRFIEKANTNELRKISIAHFLRLVHPINYFLVPKTTLSNLNIGESPELISFMREKAYSRYKNILTEYENIILSKQMEIKDYHNYSFNLEYGLGFKKSKNKEEKNLKSTTKTSSKKYVAPNDNYSMEDLSIIKAYLIDALSFRNIEREILKIDSQARGGGFIAKGIINSYGIEAKNKGKVTEKNINELISNNTGKLKMTLIKLNEHIKNCH
jgi:hypothetical protein